MPGLKTGRLTMCSCSCRSRVHWLERRQSNAEEIARRAGLLYDKVAGFVDNLSKVGLHLEQAGRAHGEAIAQLSTGRGNLLGQIEKLKDMGAKTRKNIAIEFDTEDEADPETEQPVTPDTQVPEPAFRPGKD